MKIKANIPMEVEIDDAEQKRIVHNYIFKKFGIKPENYLKNGQVAHKDTYYGSHEFQSERFIRQASEKDVAVINFLQLLQ